MAYAFCCLSAFQEFYQPDNAEDYSGYYQQYYYAA